MRATLGAALLLAAAACGQAATTPAAVTTTTTVTADRPDPRPAQVVLAVAPKPAPAAKPVAHSMFRTPEGAMRYLAKAFNAHDDVALRHVTTPHVRQELEEMRAVARDLRFTSCTAEGDTFDCVFSHAYPHAEGRGETVLVVAPATKPGWYAAHLAACG